MKYTACLKLVFGVLLLTGMGLIFMSRTAEAREHFYVGVGGPGYYAYPAPYPYYPYAYPAYPVAPAPVYPPGYVVTPAPAPGYYAPPPGYAYPAPAPAYGVVR